MKGKKDVVKIISLTYNLYRLLSGLWINMRNEQMDTLFFLTARFVRLNLVKEKILMELGLDLYLFNILTVTEKG